MSRILAIGVSIALLAACTQQIPRDALTLSPTSLEQRQLESRRFEGIKEAELLSACAGVLQDLGFNIDESESGLGVIVVSKDRDATSGGQILAAVFVAALGGGNMPIDKNQKVRAALVTAPSASGKTDSFNVRITFQRVIWNTAGQVTRSEWIKEPKIYQEFFDKLSKSVFLEAHKL